MKKDLKKEEDLILQPKNEIIPLRLTKVIVDSYDTDMNIMDKETQVNYLNSFHNNSLDIWYSYPWNWYS